MIARRLIITGRVQRVFYRDWTVATAEALDVKGWVRNRPDGSVEALLIGDEPQVTQMIDACRTGPPHAEVADIQIQEAKPEPLSGFEKRRTT